MRAWMIAGATMLTLVVGSQAAEARAGRGFGGLFSMRAQAASRPVAPHVAPVVVTSGHKPAPFITSGQVAVATAAGTTLPVVSAETLPPGDPPAQPGTAEPLRPRPVQEARALRPPCAPERRVGRVGLDGTGFCLIN